MFTEQEIVDHCINSQKDFSPNVILRPLCQEYILPNIAISVEAEVIGLLVGRKSQFAYF
ncbi:MAG: bacillithiol biosynthesis BshC [Saprospiraceae bacterium]|nr:bacillithiol biosynthesis BshC [Saprospiraceae bacterium]